MDTTLRNDHHLQSTTLSTLPVLLRGWNPILKLVVLQSQGSTDMMRVKGEKKCLCLVWQSPKKRTVALTLARRYHAFILQYHDWIAFTDLSFRAGLWNNKLCDWFAQSNDLNVLYKSQLMSMFTGFSNPGGTGLEVPLQYFERNGKNYERFWRKSTDGSTFCARQIKKRKKLLRMSFCWLIVCLPIGRNMIITSLHFCSN